MKVSTEIDNNFGYEKITQLVDNIPLKHISSSIIFFIRSVIFFILIFIENPFKTLFVVEAYFQYDVS